VAGTSHAAAREDIGVEIIGCGSLPTRGILHRSEQLCGWQPVATSPSPRDTRGIGTSFKITRDPSRPAIIGPPASATQRSVKPSAQPTLFRTQHPPQENPPLLLRQVSVSLLVPSRKASGPQNRRLSNGTGTRSIARQHVRDIQLQRHQIETCEASDMSNCCTAPELAGCTRDRSRPNQPSWAGSKDHFYATRPPQYPS
jgi:hypothetical protein